MIVGTRLPTVSDTQRNHARHCGLYEGPWSIANHIDWYQYCKSCGGPFHDRRWGNLKAAVSRNKREGFYIADHGLQRAAANRRLMRTGKPHVAVRTGGPKS